MTPQQLKSIRLKLGLTQAEMAAEIGVSTRCYQYWEAGERPMPKVAVNLVNLYI